MTKSIKGFVAGALSATVLLAGTSVFAEQIEAVFGGVNLVVNGTASDAETLLYNGTTYVPLRATAEMLGQEVNYDVNTKTAYIGAVPSAKTELPVETETPKTKDSYGVGERVEVKDGCFLTLENFNAFTTDNDFIKAKEGYTFYKINVTYENNSNKDDYISSLGNLDAYCDGISIKEKPIADSDNMLGGDVATGKKAQGSVVYELPNDWKTLEINYKAMLSDKKTIFKINK